MPDLVNVNVNVHDPDRGVPDLIEVPVIIDGPAMIGKMPVEVLSRMPSMPSMPSMISVGSFTHPRSHRRA